MTELETTAYHEAGHAVVMVLYGIRFDHATIIPGEDTLGRVLMTPAPWFNPDWDTSPYARHYTRARIVASLAGPLAEKEVRGELNTLGASIDHGHAADLALYLAGEGDAATDELARLEKDAEEDVFAFWEHIDAVAKMLLTRQTLTESEVESIMAGMPDNPDELEA